MVRLPILGHSIRPFYLAAFAAVTMISVGAYAGSVAVTSQSNAGYQGSYITDQAYFSEGTVQYNVVQASQTATTQAMAWSNGATGYVNAQTPGDWEVSFVLTVNAGAATSHTYTITVTTTGSTGIATTLYTFTFTTASSITTGQTMTIVYDTGATTWTAPSALQITVT
ncbi:MAG: hypothetical protein ACYDDF_04810 [Thermoplasmatota archaeon]